MADRDGAAAPGGDTAWRPARKPQTRGLWIALALAGVAGVGAALLIVLAGLATPAPAGQGLAALTGAELGAALVLGLGVALGLAALVLRLRLLLPARALAAETRFIAESRAARTEPGSVSCAWLAPLPEAVDALAAALGAERRRRADEVAAATRGFAEQKSRLETILRDLAEGVLICTLDHRVLLYNQAALGLLQGAGELGLGRSLFNAVAREPVLHALERLLHAAPDGAAAAEEGGAFCRLVCATADAGRLLFGRLALTTGEDGAPTGYVLTLADATRDVAALAARDTLLRDLAEGLRRPIANLSAAAETLGAFPEMPAAERAAFDAVVARESETLVAALARADQAARGLVGGHWPLADVLSLDLFRILAQRCARDDGPVVTPVGVPLWLHADSQSLVLALERLARRVAAARAGAGLDVAAATGPHAAYVDLVWSGAPIAAAMVDAWLAEALPGALGAATLDDVVRRHGGVLWSQGCGADRARLRFAVPLAAEPQGPISARPPRMPPRPEFYDFDLPSNAALAADRPLRQFAFVVFDTETTGLKPSAGDEIVSVGAVRVVNGRILTGETFARLVNPGRTIPPGSIRFHGITDAMVADAPPAAVVLPQFRAFCDGAVLVAHNAAFDLTFLRMKQAETGVVFDMPVLDTLLISAFLHPEIGDHDLDAIAARVGVPIVGRHTALGDAMATAAVFVRLLELLEGRGMVTLEALLQASRMAAELRARARDF